VRLTARYLVFVALTSAVVSSVGCGSNNSNNPFSSLPAATVPLVKLSTDTFTNSTSQHATEVEPGSFSFGSTVIAAFQVARISSGGGADIGFAISTDSGVSWQNGLLPGITTFQGGGVNAAVSDASVIYDAAHAVWMISSLPIASSGATSVVVNRSADGLNWSNPIPVSQTVQSPAPDKDWITCDNTPTSPFYGHCYVEWDDTTQGNLLWMSTSTDGGLTWAPALNPGSSTSFIGIGGNPLVQPNGNVIVPLLGFATGQIVSFSSSDGGASWSASITVAPVNDHTVAGGLRSDALPSAQIDATGNVYVIWQDCSFRTNCASNDLVMSTTADGTHWTAPARIPIDAVASTADHFIPGLGIDPATAGATAHLGLTYYYYPQTNCTAVTCALYAGFISSLDGGATWSAPTPLAGPMSLSWLPSTFSGQMVADYVATSFAAGKAYGFFAAAKPRSGSTLDEAIYTTQSGFDAAAAQARYSSAGERPVPNAKSDHSPARFYDLNHLHPIRPPTKFQPN
jgi:hypothetical protein